MLKKVTKLILILVTLPCITVGQGWLPLINGEIHNYRKSGSSFICSNIWVDSVQFAPGDSVYYLNTVFKDLDYCALRNVPVFLQREIHVSDSAYLFHSPGNYYIPKMISPGDEWVFDTTRSITAMLSEVVPYTLFDGPDSLRIILLTGTGGNLPDTLIMSKYHGIIKFPDFEEPGKHFLLAGLEKQGVGMQMPGVEDFYDFQAGARFQYKNLYESYGHNSGVRVTRTSNYVIQAVQKENNYLIYHKKGLWKETKDQWEYSSGLDTTYYYYGLIDEDDTIVFDPSSWMNYYIGQVIYFKPNKFRLFTYEWSPQFNKPVKSKDFRLFLEAGGDTSQTIMPYPTDPATVCAGLGRTYYYYQAYNDEYRMTDNLVAYEKGMETYGTFDSYCGLLDPAIKAEMSLPVHDTTLYILDELVLTLPDYFESYRWSDGSDSHVMVFNGNAYGPGTHFVSVETGFYNCYQTDTIRITVTEDPKFDNPEYHSPFAIEYNPDHSIVIRNVSQTEWDYCMQIMNANGALVMEKYYYGQLPGTATSLSIREMSAGFYVVILKAGGKSYTRKIIY